jgi:tagatose 6-phosphate kinase
VILTVTLNAAVDRTALVDEITLDRVLRPDEVLVLPGGKGVNVARAARTLGAQVTTTGVVGGPIGAWLIDALDAEGLEPHFVTEGTEPRTTYSVIERGGRSLLIYERGGEPDPEAWAALAALVTGSLITDADAVVVSGSVPPNADPGVITDIVGDCRRRALACLVDLSGDALRAALEARPTVVKINADEARASGLGASPEAMAGAVVDAGVDLGVITLGAEGAVAADRTHRYRVRGPEVGAVSTVGSGDAFAAALTLGIAEHAEIADTLRSAAAAGAANTLVLGAGRMRASDHQRLSALVAVEID